MSTFTAVPGAGSKLRGSTLSSLFSELQIFYKDRQTTVATVSSVTFSGIPTTLRRLHLSTSTRGDAAVQSVFLAIQINGDTGASYNIAYNQTSNTTSSGAAFASQTNGIGGFTAAASSQANHFSPNEIEFTGWDDPNSRAGGLAWTYIGGVFGSSTANFSTLQGIANYVTAGPYTSIKLFPASGNFIAGCDFQLMGWTT